MNTSTLILIFGVIMVSTLPLRFILQPRVRRISAKGRYKVVAVLMAVILGSQLFGSVMAMNKGQDLVAALSIISALLGAFACGLEMRKLSLEF